MKNENMGFQGCKMEAYAKGKEVPQVVQETKMGVGPRLQDHLGDKSLGSYDDLSR